MTTATVRYAICVTICYSIDTVYPSDITLIPIKSFISPLISPFLISPVLTNLDQVRKTDCYCCVLIAMILVAGLRRLERHQRQRRWRPPPATAAGAASPSRGCALHPLHARTPLPRSHAPQLRCGAHAVRPVTPPSPPLPRSLLARAQWHALCSRANAAAVTRAQVRAHQHPGRARAAAYGLCARVRAC